MTKEYFSKVCELLWEQGIDYKDAVKQFSEETLNQLIHSNEEDGFSPLYTADEIADFYDADSDSY